MTRVARPADSDERWRDAGGPLPLSFDASTVEGWAAWRAQMVHRLRVLLRISEQRSASVVTAASRVSRDGYREERVQLRVGSEVVPLVVLVPAQQRRKRAAVLALHGHTIHGKGLLLGQWPDRWLRRARYRWLGYDIARRLVKRGYVVACPDARGFGERRFPPVGPGRDPCDVEFVKRQLFGECLFGLTVQDDLHVLDYLSSRDDVDADRIGAVGGSFGGTRALFLAALDDRIRATVVSCYLSSFREFALRKQNACGSQAIPGILEWCEMSDVASAIAPRPVLFESGVRDLGFPVEAAREAFASVARCYRLLDASDRCEHEVFEGGHHFAHGRIYDFFSSWLGGVSPT